MITCSDGKQYANYPEYLKSNHWLKVKVEYKKKFVYKCSMCDKTDALQLHHTTYERIGKERLDDLVYLCQHCHTLIHKVDSKEKLTDLNTMIKQYRKKNRRKKRDEKEKLPPLITEIRKVPLDSRLEFSHKRLTLTLNHRARKTMVKTLEKAYSNNLKDFESMSDVDIKHWYDTLMKKEK